MHEQARQIRQQLGGSNADDFKTSNGWLENFRKRHGIKYRTINGESATVDECNQRFDHAPCHYRQHLVKHVISLCLVATSRDDNIITALDAVT
ncbi:unnamed protein product [Adineta ricciae]|uniref:HTH CENPB-type domain-containing protein n=1 Tax=Adineta ricciae TaxID=249248 RepID=A0A815W983_ADIRI|nr:unnamed protein product [Adineta ricciae]